MGEGHLAIPLPDSGEVLRPSEGLKGPGGGGSEKGDSKGVNGNLRLWFQIGPIAESEVGGCGGRVLKGRKTGAFPERNFKVLALPNLLPCTGCLGPPLAHL